MKLSLTYKISFLLLIMLFSAMAGSPASAQEFGSFKGEFDVRFLPDGRNMKLLNDVVYRDADGMKWTAPKGSITDGASIPQSLWTTIGAPFTGKYRNAAVIHDHYCDVKTRKWRKTHMAFYNSSRAAGVSLIRAEVMYYAVYRFGPRWQQPRSRSRAAGDSSVIVFKPRIIASEFEAMKARIERGGVGLEEIERVSDKSLRSLSRSIIE